MRRVLGFLLAFACGSAAAAGGNATAADIYTAGGDNDPHVRSARISSSSNGRYLSAAAMLERIEKESPRQALGQAYYRELAGNTLAFGMPQRAEAIYRQQVADAKGITAQSKARLDLADFYYQRGYYQQATAELALARTQLPREMLMQWDDLQSRVLLGQGRYGEAADILTQADSGDMTNFMRYNLGVALINDGRVGQGVNILDRVGRLTPFDSEALALRDKANLTLGYHFLRKYPAVAAPPSRSSAASVPSAPTPTAPCSDWAGPIWRRAATSRKKPSWVTRLRRIRPPLPLSPPSACCCVPAISTPTASIAAPSWRRSPPPRRGKSADAGSAA